MALSQSSTCTQVSTLVHADLTRPHSPKSQAPATATPIKSDAAAFHGASLTRSTGPQTRSMAAPKATKASAIALKELAVRVTEAGAPEDALVSQVSEDFGDAVESVVEDPSATTMRVRRSSGKSATRTSRRRALVMCLALGVVRPCAGNVAGGMGIQTGNIRRTASSSFTVSGNLSSQVSIASSMKAANLLEDKEDDSAKL